MSDRPYIAYRTISPIFVEAVGHHGISPMRGGLRWDPRRGGNIFEPFMSVTEGQARTKASYVEYELSPEIR